jgi:hypothetical protein
VVNSNKHTALITPLARRNVNQVKSVNQWELTSLFWFQQCSNAVFQHVFNICNFFVFLIHSSTELHVFLCKFLCSRILSKNQPSPKFKIYKITKVNSKVN